MNPKLQAIAELGASQLQLFIQTGDAVVEEAQIQDTAPKLKIGFSIGLDLDKDSMETALTFGVRHKLSAACSIPDPNQAKLPLE